LDGPYFQSLLSSGIREEHDDEISLCVRNIHVAYDIITSVYGIKTRSKNIPDWRYVLEYIRCCDYWQLSWDQSLITNLVPPENFEQSVGLVDIVHPNDMIINTISKKLPGLFNYKNSQRYNTSSAKVIAT
jgi:hypothetical protein